MTRQFGLMAGIVLFLLGSCSDPGGELIPGRVMVLKGAVLFDGTGSEPRSETTIVIRGERISHIGRFEDFRFGDEAEIVDVSGKFVLPGFFDTHAHVETPRGDWPASLRTLLDFGITGIRDTGVAKWVGNSVRDGIESGALVGPRMQVSGIIIDGPESIHDTYASASTEEEMREVIRSQAADGVNMIKIYMYVEPELVSVAIDEAHRLGLRTIGHLKKTSWTEAAEMGIDTLVHSGPEGPTHELLAEGSRERLLGKDWPSSFRQWAREAGDLDLDGPQFERLVETLLKNRVEVNPTLVLIEAFCWGDDPEHLEKLEPDVASEATRAYWGTDWRSGNPFTRQMGFTQEDLAVAKEAFQTTLEMIRRFHERGVLITAGSDLSMPWIVPGASFHRELELLTRAGIPPDEVLIIATRNGAEVMGLLEETGTVEVGKLADLVVLSADPTQDIRNTRRIEKVLLAGRVVSDRIRALN